MATPHAWGIDIGNRALKAVRLAEGPEGLFIEDFDVVEHERAVEAVERLRLARECRRGPCEQVRVHGCDGSGHSPLREAVNFNRGGLPSHR